MIIFLIFNNFIFICIFKSLFNIINNIILKVLNEIYIINFTIFKSIFPRTSKPKFMINQYII